MGPDPEKLKRDSFDRPDYVINQLDDEMDVENLQNDNHGYVILNQNNEEQYMAINDDDSESESDNGDFNIQEQPQDIPHELPNVPIIQSASSQLIANVWNNSTSSNNIEITNEKSQQITQIMSKINLPNAPNWLNEINTENILDRIRNKTRENDPSVNN